MIPGAILPDQLMEGYQGWVMEGVLSQASFRCPPLGGQTIFTVLSMHISNIYAKKKRGIAKKSSSSRSVPLMLSQHIDVLQVISKGAAIETTSVSIVERLCRLRFASAAGPYAIAGTHIDSKQLG